MDKYEINHNIAKAKKGDVLCYHVGYLPADREFRPIIGTKMVEVKTKDGTAKEVEKNVYGDITDDAIILDKIANVMYEKSTICYETPTTSYVGSGEFALFQEKLGFLKYAYFAKKIK